MSVDGGARIGDISMATVVIQSNDSPYGTVSFESMVSVVTEGDNDTVAMVPVRRRWAGEMFCLDCLVIPQSCYMSIKHSSNPSTTLTSITTTIYHAYLCYQYYH